LIDFHLATFRGKRFKGGFPQLIFCNLNMTIKFGAVKWRK